MHPEQAVGVAVQCGQARQGHAIVQAVKAHRGQAVHAGLYHLGLLKRVGDHGMAAIAALVYPGGQRTRVQATLGHAFAAAVAVHVGGVQP